MRGKFFCYNPSSSLLAHGSPLISLESPKFQGEKKLIFSYSLPSHTSGRRSSCFGALGATKKTIGCKIERDAVAANKAALRVETGVRHQGPSSSRQTSRVVVSLAPRRPLLAKSEKIKAAAKKARGAYTRAARASQTPPRVGEPPWCLAGHAR